MQEICISRCESDAVLDCTDGDILHGHSES